MAYDDNENDNNYVLTCVFIEITTFVNEFSTYENNLYLKKCII